MMASLLTSHLCLVASPILLQANRKAVAAELKKLAEEEMSARIALDLKRQMEVGLMRGAGWE